MFHLAEDDIVNKIIDVTRTMLIQKFLYEDFMKKPRLFGGVEIIIVKML